MQVCSFAYVVTLSSCGVNIQVALYVTWHLLLHPQYLWGLVLFSKMSRIYGFFLTGDRKQSHLGEAQAIKQKPSPEMHSGRDGVAVVAHLWARWTFKNVWILFYRIYNRKQLHSAGNANANQSICRGAWRKSARPKCVLDEILRRINVGNGNK